MTAPRRIRVCHVITQLELGGAQENTLTTVETLPQDRYETHLVCGPGGMLDARARESIGTRCHFMPFMVRPICPIRDTLAFFSLKTHFEKERYDIVHTHSSKAGILGRLAARAAGIPLILHTAHGWGFHDFQASPIRRMFIAAERVAARYTDVIVAESDVTIQMGLAAGVGRPSQYVIIRSGVDSRPYREPANVAEIRQKMGIDPSRPVVAMIACLKPQKSPQDLLEIASRVKPLVPQIQFVLAGDGELRPQMEEGITRLGLQNTVQLLGWLDGITDLLRVSDLFLLTSRWEGLPLVFLESIAAGVPIVATNVGGAPDAVTDGVNGYLFIPGDVGGMADRIVDLFRHPSKLSTLRAGVSSSWREEFDFRDGVRRIDELYQELRA